MKRGTSIQIKKLPDAINADIVGNNFSILPNTLLRDPNLSWKATGLLCFLLSNRKGWKTHITTLSASKTDGEFSVRAALKELEENGYLLRFQYVDNFNKRRGSFFCYTSSPFLFNLQKHTKYLKKKGWTFTPSTETTKQLWKQISEPLTRNPHAGNPNAGNHRLIKTKYNKTKKDKKINKKYRSIAERLAEIISSHKKINCNSSIHSWVKPIELLCTKDLKINGTPKKRILKRVNKALEFYADHIGEQYIPVIQSGKSFREKFIKLEDAMQREKQSSIPDKQKQSSHYDNYEREYV